MFSHIHCMIQNNIYIIFGLFIKARENKNNHPNKKNKLRIFNILINDYSDVLTIGTSKPNK